MIAANSRIRVSLRRGVSTCIAFALIAGSTMLCLAADPTMVDPANLPRLEGAQFDPAANASRSSFVYAAPGAVPAVEAATRKLLITDGWTPFLDPLEDKRTYYKKGALGLYVSYTMVNGRPDQSRVSYVPTRLNVDVPLPDGATDVIHEFNRPYLSFNAAGSVASMLAFYEKNMAASGFAPLQADEIASRWPSAKPDDKIENGAAVYYKRAAPAKPVRLSVQQRSDGRVQVDMQVAPFALPANLEAGQDSYGMPRPTDTKSMSATNGRTRKELKASVAADMSVLLAFYRRELALRNWKEDERSTTVNANEASVMFSSDEGRASLRLTRQYDLSVASLIIQVSEAALAAQEKAKRDESDKFMRDAQDLARSVIAGDNQRRAAAEVTAAAQPVESLRPSAEKGASIPVPEGATEIKSGDGQLEYSSTSSVKSLAEFHRAAMKQLGWREGSSVINNANMVVMDFTKGNQKISMRVMQMGPKARMSANGDGLKSAAAPVAATAKEVEQNLEADADKSGFPVPKGYTLSAPGTWAAQGGGQTPFRREFDASVPASVTSVLAFYRRELSKRQWKEMPEGALTNADKVRLAFNTPEGPAVFKLERVKAETTINIVVKNPDEAKKAGVLPTPGQGKLFLGNMGDKEIVVTIAEKAIKVAAGSGSSQKKDGPTLDLRPGKYKYTVKAAGRPAHSAEIEISANETWGMIVSPAGDDTLTMQLY